MRCDSSEIAPVEYIPAATGKSAATVSTPALPNPFSRADGGASRRVMAIVIAPTKTTHVGNLSHAMTANIATSRIRVNQACSGMFEEPTIPYGFSVGSAGGPPRPCQEESLRRAPHPGLLLAGWVFLLLLSTGH